MLSNTTITTELAEFLLETTQRASLARNFASSCVIIGVKARRQDEIQIATRNKRVERLVNMLVYFLYRTMIRYRFKVMKAILRFLVVNRNEFKIAWYLQASCPKPQAPRISTDASKGCVVMAERTSTSDKLTTSIFGIVLNDLRWKNAAIIIVFPSIDKIANSTTIIDSNAAITGDR